jgi:hypothetical protein
MLPIARALSLDQEKVNDLVENTRGDEEEQLKSITKAWTEKAENNELPQLRDFLASVSQQGKAMGKDSLDVIELFCLGFLQQ